jgi:hypothetical protein
MFAKATRKQSKLRAALIGASGSGKTHGALMIAKGLGGKTAVIDTENGSAALYSNMHEFDVMCLEAPYSPEKYIDAIKLAEKCGYDVLIIDSATHEWTGCLDLLDKVAKASYKGDTWRAWNDITPRHNAFLEAIVSSNMHIIVTCRAKTETARQEIDGKTKVVKLGLKTEQRDGFEYEFTVVLDLVHDGHYATASKDRTGIFTGKYPEPITIETGKALLEWLNDGESEDDVFNRALAAINQSKSEDEIRSHLTSAIKLLPNKKDELVSAATNRKNELLDSLKKNKEES